MPHKIEYHNVPYTEGNRDAYPLYVDDTPLRVPMVRETVYLLRKQGSPAEWEPREFRVLRVDTHYYTDLTIFKVYGKI